MIKLSKRHSAYRSAAGGDIPIRDQYQPLGGRMKLMARVEEVHPGRPTQPLARYHHCHLIISVELAERTLRRVGGENAVVGREPSGEVALNGSEDVLIRVNGEQYRLAHASYPVPDVFAPPSRRGASTSVSSV